jgi:hypothetical protein
VARKLITAITWSIVQPDSNILQIRLSDDSVPKYVVDKLCATMATYFIQSPVPWTLTVRHVICSLHNGNFVALDMLSTYPDTSQIVGQLPAAKLFVVTRFCTILAEDVESGTNLGPQYHHLDALLKSISTPLLNEIRKEGMVCFSAWITYGYEYWKTDPVALQMLQNLTPMAIGYLLHHDEDVRDPTLHLFVNILESRSKFLQKEHLESISLMVRKDIGPQCLQQIMDFNDPTIVAFSKLIVAYGKLVVKDLISERDKESSQEIIGMLDNHASNSSIR